MKTIPREHQTEEIEIQSEGKVFSQKNSERLQSLFLEIGNLLKDSGVVDNDKLKDLLDENHNGIPDGLEGSEPSEDEEYEGEEYEDEDEAYEDEEEEYDDYEDEDEAYEDEEEEYDDYEDSYEDDDYDDTDEYDDDGYDEEYSKYGRKGASEISASSKDNFVDRVNRISWYDKLRHTLEFFQQSFVSIHELPREEGAASADTESLGLIQDLTSLLTDLHHSHPGVNGMIGIPVFAEADEYEDDDDDIDDDDDTESYEPDEVDDDPWQDDDPVEDTPYFTPDEQDYTETDIEAEPDGEDYYSDAEDVSDREDFSLYASASDGEGRDNSNLDNEEIPVSFNCNWIDQESESTTNIIAAESQTQADNRHPFEGVLFKIDQSSEASPSIGPSLPLYIPRHVAEAAVNTVSGLPLDAHQSLRQHSNQDITGVILSAQIRNDDFIVNGFLWPWSKPDKVEQIAANARDLGMSMNAIAKGRKADVNGRQVFWVESLKLLGANILFSDKATFRQTRVSASGASREELAEEMIAASSGDFNFYGENDMDYELREHLNSFNETLSSLKYLIQAQNEQVAELEARLESVEEDRDERYAQISAQAAEDERQYQDAKLAELVAAAVRKAVNPHNSPNRITTSLAASSATMSRAGDVNNLKIQLAAEKLALEKLREGGGNQKARLAMVSRINELEALIAQGDY